MVVMVLFPVWAAVSAVYAVFFAEAGALSNFCISYLSFQPSLSHHWDVRVCGVNDVLQFTVFNTFGT